MPIITGRRAFFRRYAAFKLAVRRGAVPDPWRPEIFARQVDACAAELRAAQVKAPRGDP